MGIVSVSLNASHERRVLEEFARLLPQLVHPLVAAMTPRSCSFETGAVEHVGRNGLHAAFCQHFPEGGEGMISTIAIVDDAGLARMRSGEEPRPPVSMSSYAHTTYEGIQGILGTLGEAVERRLAEHEADPDIAAGFDWCTAIERRTVRRARAARRAA